MMIELFVYETSILNPALKLINIILFGISSILVYWIKGSYNKGLKRIINFLFLSLTFFAFGSILRYFGHGFIFGFTKEFSLKWFQSLSYLVAALFFVFSTRTLSKLPLGLEKKN